jgi:hypothetical protein
MKTFLEFVEQIEKDNERFNSLSKEEKKVEVCKDVLARLKFNNITAKKYHFYSSKTGSIYKPAKELLNSCNLSAPVCDCCAKGALFLSYVGRVNNYNFKSTITNISKSESVTEYNIIKELFSDEELDAIEIAFEGYSYMHIISNKEIDKVLAWKKKLKQGSTEKGRVEDLI